MVFMNFLEKLSGKEWNENKKRSRVLIDRISQSQMRSLEWDRPGSWKGYILRRNF